MRHLFRSMEPPGIKVLNEISLGARNMRASSHTNCPAHWSGQAPWGQLQAWLPPGPRMQLLFCRQERATGCAPLWKLPLLKVANWCPPIILTVWEGFPARSLSCHCLGPDFILGKGRGTLRAWHWPLLSSSGSHFRACWPCSQELPTGE